MNMQIELVISLLRSVGNDALKYTIHVQTKINTKGVIYQSALRLLLTNVELSSILVVTNAIK